MTVFASRKERLCFHILDGGISDESFGELEKLLLQLRSDFKIVRYRLSGCAQRDFQDAYGKRMAYKRLLLPDLLKDLDFVLYCDVDFMWLGDVAELWKQRDENVLLKATHDLAPETISREQRWFSVHGIPFDNERYFCSGLLLMNLKLFRTGDVAAKVYAFLDKHPDVNLADQSALNAVLSEQVGFLPQKWQVFSRDVTSHQIATGDVAVHYAGEVPWRRRSKIDMLTDTVLVWHRFNAKLRGISLWRSLRLYFGAYEIFGRRLMFRFAVSPLTKKIFRIALRLTSRKDYEQRFGMWWRSLDPRNPVICTPPA